MGVQRHDQGVRIRVSRGKQRAHKVSAREPQTLPGGGPAVRKLRSQHGTLIANSAGERDGRLEPSQVPVVAGKAAFLDLPASFLVHPVVLSRYSLCI